MLLYNVVMIPVLLVGWVFSVGYEGYRECDRVQRSAQLIAEVLAASAVIPLQHGEYQTANDLLAVAGRQAFIDWAVIDVAGAPADRFFASAGRSLPAIDKVRQALAPSVLELPLVRQPIKHGSQLLGYVLIKTNLSPIFRHYLTVLLGGLIACVTLFALGRRIVYRQVNTITGPIEALATAARGVTEAGDFKLRVEATSEDEVGQLGRDFNRMLTLLEDRESSLRTELEQRERVQARLDHLAHFDQVTQLPNRHYFSRRLELAVEKAVKFDEPVALFFIDLDNFKYVNDTLGHHAGDALLARVGQRIVRALRSSDVVCRIGGDEFAVILEQVSEDWAFRAAEKVIEALAAPLLIEDQEVVVTASVGIALCPKDTRDQNTLVRYADSAMYLAKSSGKNRWAGYSNDMSAASSKRLEIEAQLRHAVAENEFVLFYQPIVDAQTLHITSAEALVRWIHPEHGVVEPGQFIALAEDTGLIVPLGRALLRQACRQIVEWKKQGMVVPPIAVNVSGRQIEQSDFVEHLQHVLDETGCRPGLLTIELTESILMLRQEAIIDTLDRVRAMGVSIAIDDFGTGYSSMTYLKYFSVSKLKIDRSFIKDIVDSKPDLAVTRAMIALGLSLGLEVVAEGVEQAEQLGLLKLMGCSSIQGYYVSRPLTAQQFAGFVTAQRQKELKADLKIGGTAN